MLRESFPVGIFLQATAVILAALFAAGMLRGCSAAVRHNLWIAAAVALLLLPLLSAVNILPPINIRIPGIPPVAPPTTNLFPAALLRSGGLSVPRRNAIVGVDFDGIAFRALTILFACWFLIVSALLLRILRAHLKVARVISQSPINSSGDWTGHCAGLCAELGITARVELRWADGIATPMAYGLIRAVLLLPPTARDWSEQERRLVLLHELAHVRRKDCLTQLVAQITRAFWWPHPGAWYLAYAVAREREAACDDTVLLNGGAPPLYASILLMCAAGHRRSSLALAGIGFTRPSQIEGRIEGVLDARRDRRPSSAAGRAILGAMFMSIAVCIAAVRPALTSASAPNVGAAPLPHDANILTAESPVKKLVRGYSRTDPARRSIDTIVANEGAATLGIAGRDIVYEFTRGAYGPNRMIFPLANVRSAAVVRGGIIIDMSSRPANEPDSSYRGRLFVPGVDARAAQRFTDIISRRVRGGR